MTDTYQVLAKRWDKGWELHIEGVGVTQARRLSEAEAMVRDLIVRREEIPETSFDLTWSFEVSDELDAEVRATRAAVANSAAAQAEAAAKSRAVARRLADERPADKKGATALEYGVIGAAAVAVLLVTFNAFYGALGGVFTRIAAAM